MALQILTTFLSDDQTKEATVIRDTTEGRFKVTVKSDTGSTFSANFDSEEDAEAFAEDWVL